MSIELTKIDKTYSHMLKDNKTVIDGMWSNKAVSLFEMKSKIKDLVMSVNDKPLEEKSPDTKRFLMNVDRQVSKDSLITLVYNSMLKADGYGVDQ